ncbi:hypothetical protein AM500_12930 [Bacillus sp. FJAT-18017]|uniref:hypothetical protein n=1 Tax=Bacillus sp. FJAT-18017 TaxID=1705566 RepID=UPI0006B06CCF|nr:hypothetical protein [Bacillus sp. FJAT-18017]ALC90589.1 hypothetical protein AM500_12930 [Bacillus sp. FJAT-18017]
MSIEGFVTILLECIALWLAFQWTYALAVLLLGSTMVDYYDWGTWENPENALQKIITFIMAFFVGAGPYVYKLFRFKKKYNWLTWRLAFLGVLIGGGIAAALAYFAIEAVLNFLFL